MTTNLDTFEPALAARIGVVLKWLCKVEFIDIGKRRAVRLSFPPPDDVPKHLGHMVGKSVHVGLTLNQYLEGTDRPVSDAVEDLCDIFKRAGNDETKDGWRHSFNPVTGKFYRNNVYGEAA